MMGALRKASGDSSLGTLVLACFLGLAGWLMALYPFPATQAGAHGVAREELRWQAENSPFYSHRERDKAGGSPPKLPRVTEESEGWDRSQPSSRSQQPSSRSQPL